MSPKWQSRGRSLEAGVQRGAGCLSARRNDVSLDYRRGMVVGREDVIERHAWAREEVKEVGPREGSQPAASSHIHLTLV